MSHVPLARDPAPERDAAVLPAVRDMRLSMLCAEYQERFPGSHEWAEAGTESETAVDCVKMTFSLFCLCCVLVPVCARGTRCISILF